MSIRKPKQNSKKKWQSADKKVRKKVAKKTDKKPRDTVKKTYQKPSDNKRGQLSKARIESNNLSQEKPQEEIGFGVRHMTIEAAFDGQRIDNYLRRILPGLPKSRLYQMIRKGEVRLNKKRVKVETRVSTGDDLRVPPIVIKNNQSPNIPDHLIQQIKASVLHQDKDYLVIDKPSGITVHSGSDHQYGLIDIIHQAFEDKNWELCHRLDKGTSGCLVLANNRRALNQFQTQSINGNVYKQYLALVKGRWTANQLIVDEDLDKKQGRGTETAQSIFTTREKYRKMSLMQVVIKTGRTHQIRRHAMMQGYPIAMDDRHGDFAWNKKLKEHQLERMFLHAHIIKFESFEETIHVSAELPEHLENFLQKFVIC